MYRARAHTRPLSGCHRSEPLGWRAAQRLLDTDRLARLHAPHDKVAMRIRPCRDIHGVHLWIPNQRIGVRVPTGNAVFLREGPRAVRVPAHHRDDLGPHRVERGEEEEEPEERHRRPLEAVVDEEVVEEPRAAAPMEQP